MGARTFQYRRSLTPRYDKYLKTRVKKEHNAIIPRSSLSDMYDEVHPVTSTPAGTGTDMSTRSCRKYTPSVRGQVQISKKTKETNTIIPRHGGIGGGGYYRNVKIINPSHYEHVQIGRWEVPPSAKLVAPMTQQTVTGKAEQFFATSAMVTQTKRTDLQEWNREWYKKRFQVR